MHVAQAENKMENSPKHGEDHKEGESLMIQK